MATLTLKLSLDDAAQRTDNGSLDLYQIARLLLVAYRRVDNGLTDFPIKDFNGVTVGRLTIKGK